MDRFSTRLAASLIEDRHREATELRRSAAILASATRGRAPWLGPIRRAAWLAREHAGRSLSGGGRSIAPQEGHM